MHVGSPKTFTAQIICQRSMLLSLSIALFAPVQTDSNSVLNVNAARIGLHICITFMNKIATKSTNYYKL